MNPTVSVVIPTHDRPMQLQRLIDCLCRQTLQPKQIVIVNDGSEEISENLLSRAASSDSRLSVIRQQTASSASSRNTGMAAATGNIVLCLDDDMIPDETFIADLVDLYRKDTDKVISGIGVPYEEQWNWKYRLWNWFSLISGRMRFRPRVRASSYIRTGSALAGLIEPAVMISGGAMSLRGEVARRERFDETMGPYAFGEDREFSYRIGRTEPLFNACRMRIKHSPGPGGRGSWLQRGRLYVANMLHIVDTSVEPGPGTEFLVYLDFTSAFVQHLLWGALTAGVHNVLFAAGLAQELLATCLSRVRRVLCG